MHILHINPPAFCSSIHCIFVATRTTKTAYVQALSSAGCTSGLVTVTLTVNDTTAPTFNAPAALNIVCNSATATTAINNWLSTATATDACGAIATITNDYIAPANLCNVSGGVITVTFVAKDTFGNVLTKTSTIKLGVTPLTVVSDTFTVGNGLTATTTGSVLNNDRLNGNKEIQLPKEQAQDNLLYLKQKVIDSKYTTHRILVLN